MTTFTPTIEMSRRYFESRLQVSLPARNKVQARCIFHDDKTPSLSLNLKMGVWHCHACNVGGGILDFERTLTNKADAECWEAINATIGRDAPKTSKPKRGRIVATYDYHDAAGKVAYQSIRFAEPKSFQQRRPDGNGGFIWNMDGVVRVPFNLPALVRANVALIAEGEKDALSLQKAATGLTDDGGKLSYAASCNVSGAGKWLDSYSQYFAGKKVFVFQDNDDPGREHSQQVCASVSKYAHAVQLVGLTDLAEHGDVSDFLEAHSPSELFALMQAAPVWTVPIAPSAPSMTPEEAHIITSELLEACRAWIRRYIVVSDEQAVIMAAWTLHTYVFDAFEVTPYLFISSPEKGSGKSTLLRILKAVSCRSRSSSGMSGAALARVVEASRPSLFLDELDAQMKGDKEKAENIRGILNSGYEAEGVYTRCVGNDFAVKDFPTFCPKCLAGIGELWDTVADRSITIKMRRKLPDESVEPDRRREVKAAAAPIKARLEEWAVRGVPNLLRKINPAPIASFNSRQNDNAEPLLAIATLAGGGWPQRLTGALQTVCGAAGEHDTSNGAILLADIRAVFDECKTDGIPSKDLAAQLCEIEGRPWAEWSHGKGLTANTLAGQLKKYDIRPHSIRVGDKTPKGYQSSDFEDSWARYCACNPLQNATPPQPPSLLAETAFSNRNTHPPVAVTKSASNPHEQRSVAAVAVEKQVYGQESICGTLFDVEL